MKKFRIVIFAGYYFPYRGGYVESLHGLARRLVEAGHSVTVVTTLTHKSPWEETIDGVRVIRLRTWHILGKTYPVVLPTWRTFRILRQLAKERPDVVSAQTRFFTTSFLGAYFALRYRIPLIHTERGAYHSVVKNPLVGLVSRMIDHTAGMIVVRLAKRNVGVSKAACDFLKHLWARKVVHIPNGVELLPALSDEEKVKLKKRWGFAPKDRLLLFVGRLVYAKGVQDVLVVFSDLLKRDPHLKLIIAGEGSYRQNLEFEVEALGLDERVRFLGSLEHVEVDECLQMADVLVNPSHSEGLPRSVLEAAAAGLPMVATDVGGTREIIEHNKTGLLVNLQDTQSLAHALSTLLDDPTRADKLGDAARHHAKKTFAWPKIVKSYVDLFEEVV